MPDRSPSRLREALETIEKETRRGGYWTLGDVNDAAKMALTLSESAPSVESSSAVQSASPAISVVGRVSPATSAPDEPAMAKPSTVAQPLGAGSGEGRSGDDSRERPALPSSTDKPETPRTDALAESFGHEWPWGRESCMRMFQHARQLESELALLRQDYDHERIRSAGLSAQDVLRELVELKDLHDSIERSAPPTGDAVAEYQRRKPKAWDAARAVLAGLTPSHGGAVQSAAAAATAPMSPIPKDVLEKAIQFRARADDAGFLARAIINIKDRENARG